MEGCSDTARASARAVLPGGEAVTICLVERGDESLLGEFLTGLGLDASRLRFFTAAAEVDRGAGVLSAAARERIGLIALDGRGSIIGHALCVESAPGAGETAVAVAGSLGRPGLSDALLTQLSRVAARRGLAVAPSPAAGGNGARSA